MIPKHRPHACNPLSNSVLICSLIGCLVAYSSRPAAGEAKHACDYLTVDEVASVLGFQVSQPERLPANPLGQTICFFDAPQEQGMRFAQLQFVASSSKDLKAKGYTTASYFDTIVGYMDTPLPVDRIGEKAFWGGAGISMGAGLHVRAAGVYFVVLAKSANDEDSLSKSKNLAAIVVDKAVRGSQRRLQDFSAFDSIHQTRCATNWAISRVPPAVFPTRPSSR